MAPNEYEYSFTFESEGIGFIAYVVTDDNGDDPTERGDGHGVITDWEYRSKRPDEWILCDDGRRDPARRFYDVRASMEKAKREQWGLPADRIEEWTKRNGRAPTSRQVIAAAVRADFEFLRGYFNDDWNYVGVCVVPADDEESERMDSPYQYALWGIESNDREYIEETAQELAREYLFDRCTKRQAIGAQCASLEFAAELESEG